MVARVSSPLSPRALLGVAGLLAAGGVALYVGVARKPAPSAHAASPTAPALPPSAATPVVPSAPSAPPVAPAPDPRALEAGRIDPALSERDQARAEARAAFEAAVAAAEAAAAERVAAEAAAQAELEGSGDELLPDTPSRRDVARAMRSAARHVLTCAQEGASGTLVTRVTFQSDGSVRDVTFRPDAPIRQACLRDALMADLRVPPFGRPTFTVSYPFRVR